MSKKIISSTIITLILLTTVIYARGAYKQCTFYSHGSGTNEEVTKQDITKKLEECDYSQKELQEILKEGKAFQGIDYIYVSKLCTTLIKIIERS